MEKILKAIDGKKTYLVAASAILTALVGYAEGAITLVQFIEAVFASIGLGTVRHAIKKGEM